MNYLVKENIRVSYNMINIDHHFIHNFLSDLYSKTYEKPIRNILIDIYIEKQNNNIYIISIIYNSNKLTEDYLMLTKYVNEISKKKKITSFINIINKEQTLFRYKTKDYLLQRIRFNYPQIITIFFSTILR